MNVDRFGPPAGKGDRIEADDFETGKWRSADHVAQPIDRLFVSVATAGLLTQGDLHDEFARLKETTGGSVPGHDERR